MLVLSPASAVISSVISSCFIYELVKSTKLAFLRNTLLSENPHASRIPVQRTLPPPMPSEFQFKEPPHAYGYFLELPNTSRVVTKISSCQAYEIALFTDNILHFGSQ